MKFLKGAHTFGPLGKFHRGHRSAKKQIIETTNHTVPTLRKLQWLKKKIGRDNS